jgi:hypothetical protein
MDESRSRDRSLSVALRAVAADDERMGVSAEVHARLFAEVHAIARARQRRRTLLGLAAAAALFFGILGPLWYSSREREAPVLVPERLAAATREVTTSFFPLTYSEVPAADAHVIRMQVPRAALATFGVVSFDAAGDPSTVLADVVVGNDGLARAVRFVRVVGAGEQELEP